MIEHLVQHVEHEAVAAEHHDRLGLLDRHPFGALPQQRGGGLRLLGRRGEKRQPRPLGHRSIPRKPRGRCRQPAWSRARLYGASALRGNANRFSACRAGRFGTILQPVAAIARADGDICPRSHGRQPRRADRAVPAAEARRRLSAWSGRCGVLGGRQCCSGCSRFQSVNLAYGSRAGDGALIEIAQRSSAGG